MSASDVSAEELATEILANNEDISPLFSEVVEHVKKFRACGLPDEKVRESVPGMFRIKEQAAECGGLSPPDGEEIRVLSLPRKYQRRSWR